VAGEIVWLGALLFVLGIVLLVVEFFVLPGFGVIGISGIVLIAGSLGLVTLDNIPQTSQEWLGLGSNMLIVGVTMIGAVFVALTIGRFLPKIPYANRMFLPDHDTYAEDDPPHPQAEVGANAALLGTIGVAVTPLRPAGMARFGEEFIDVVTEGGYVAPGGRVQVVEIEGNRIVVKDV
jgi:membrane-bound ClpP family serine protease